LIDNLARYRNLGWKIFFFRILKALFHYLFASITAEKSEAILISDFPLTGSVNLLIVFSVLQFHCNSLMWICLSLFAGIHQALSVCQLLFFSLGTFS